MSMTLQEKQCICLLDARVTILEEAPSGPGDLTIELVTGSDGAQYEKTTYPGGVIRYKPVYAILP
jgi:hypothetical protein